MENSYTIDKDSYTYYHILEVNIKASTDEIKKAYHKRALELHPDKNDGSEVSKKKFQELQEAYQTLSNPEKKKCYDEENARKLYNVKIEKVNELENELDLYDAVHLFTLSIVCSNLGLDYKAANYQQKAVDIVRDSAEAYYYRGLVLYMLRYYDRAVDDFTKAIECNENFAEAYWTRGRVYSKMGKYDLSNRDQFKAIDLKPGYAEDNDIVFFFKYGKKMDEVDNELKYMEFFLGVSTWLKNLDL